MDASHNESGATCWVPGCNQVVTEELLRVSHRVQTCAHHRLAPAVLVKGTLKRFCQQCTRFHELAKFDGQKRSCRMRLGKLNKRRYVPYSVRCAAASTACFCTLLIPPEEPDFRRRDNKAKEMFGYGYPPGRDESPQKTTRTSGSDEQVTYFHPNDPYGLTRYKKLRLDFQTD